MSQEQSPQTGGLNVTQVLQAAAHGDAQASEQLLPLVYEELRRVAHAAMGRERAGGAGFTLQATALVHEAYLRLVGDQPISWDSRAHFFGAAAQAMRRILVDRARTRKRLRHGGGRARVDLHDVAEVTDSDAEVPEGTDLVALDEALNRLREQDGRACDVVMLKYFAGLTNDQIASILGVSSATVRNDWTFAKAWLLRSMSDGETPT